MKMIFASTADSLYSVPYCTSDWISTPLTQVDTCQVNDSDVIKTFFETKTKTLKFFQDQLLRPRPSLVFKTKTKTLHLKTKTFLWCILEADRKAFFFFGRKQKCQRKWNSIYAQNETKTKMDIHFRLKNENESHMHIQTPSQPYNAPPIPRPVSPFCRWSLLTGFHFPHVYSVCIQSLWHFSRWHFNPWTVCFPGLLLPSESSFP